MESPAIAILDSSTTWSPFTSKVLRVLITVTVTVIIIVTVTAPNSVRDYHKMFYFP